VVQQLLVVRAMTKRALAAFALLCLCACNTTLDPTHYSQTCTLETDCTGVHAGQQCGGCTCPNAAINVSEASRYAADVAALRRWCGPGPAIECSCVAENVHCTSGACVLTLP
jgi:hypothetical protein